jgi:putative transposase
MLLDHHYPQFYTATCLKWQQLLEKDNHKEIILTNLKWLVDRGWIKVYGLVIMPNHIHYLWHVHPNMSYDKMKSGHLKNTAQRIKQDLVLKKEFNYLESYFVGAKDRAYQFWERNSLSVDVYTPSVIHQKLDYIYQNPVRGKWMLCKEPADYPYSSASFYETGIDRFGFLTHISEIGYWTKNPEHVNTHYFLRKGE